MEAYRSGFLGSQMAQQQAMPRKSLYGYGGKYSHLTCSQSTIGDEDEHSLLSAVLENFSSGAKCGRDLAEYSQQYPAFGMKIKPNAERIDPLADFCASDAFMPQDSVYQKQRNFNWSSNTPTSCFGTDKAQLYERLFDSYIDQFNAGRLQNAPTGYVDVDDFRAPNTVGTGAWETMETIKDFENLSLSRKPTSAAQSMVGGKIDRQSVVDKNKALWRRKRSKLKTLEKKAIAQLTGQEFQDAMDHLLDILESLYRDQIPPTFFNVRSRFVEFDTKNIPVEHIMNICQRRQDIFRVETNEALNQTYIYLVTPPSYFTKWIDRNDLTDTYPEEMWQQFLDFLVELLNNPEQMMPVFPGSIYGTAKVFQKLELSFFEGMTLGTLCHIVQLAVRVRKLLMYELKTLKPNLVSILQACVNRSK